MAVALALRSTPLSLRHSDHNTNFTGTIRSDIQVGRGIFRQGKISGGDFILQIGAAIPPSPETFCAIRAISCSLVRQLTFFLCREVLVPMYCMSGSVFMLVRTQKFFVVYPVYRKA